MKRWGAADINGDGRLDLAAPSFDETTVTMLLGRSSSEEIRFRATRKSRADPGTARTLQ